MTPDTCISDDIKYLFWINNNQCFIQRFDECAEHKPANIARHLFDLLKYNYGKISRDTIKAPEYDEIVKGKTITYTVIRDHSCHTMFEINIGTKSLRKDIDSFDIETKYIDEKYLNKNYLHNRNTALYKLKILAESEVSRYNKIPPNKTGAH
jgi:hypothetical protein